MRRCAVLGSPVGHSLSPVLHRAAYEALGLQDWWYTAVECDEQRLPGFLAGMDDSWALLSLTMPLKRAVIPLLDEVSPLARTVEAVNTVLVEPGRLRGDNTDVAGIAGSLATARTGWTASDWEGTVVLGGGATACSALAALARLGATRADVRVRDPRRAGRALEVGRRLALQASPGGWPGPEEVVAASALVSTVPAGATDELAEGLRTALERDRLRLPDGAVFLDVLYHPWPTPLAEVWRDAGGVVVGGLELLVRQAARQVELATGQAPPLDAMRSAGERVLRRRRD